MRNLVTRSNVFARRFLPEWFWYWFALPHEVFHYLAARLLGVPATLVSGKVIFQKTDRWRKSIILLAPAVAGLVMLGMPDGDWRLLLGVPDGLFFLLAWWLGCTGDAIDLWITVQSSGKRS